MSEATILYYDEEGKPVTIFDLVTGISVTASLEAKRSDGNYGSNGGFISQTLSATVPPGLSADSLRVAGDELYAFCIAAIETRFEKRPPQTVPQQTSKPAAVQSAPSEGGPEWDALGQGGRQLQFAPKAEERIPGDTWQTTVTAYELTSKNLTLWADGRFPEATLYPNSPKYPGGWAEKKPKDGERYDLHPAWVVTQQVSEKKNGKGFYYVDVVLIDIADTEAEAA